jgi:O-antigen/teichoic acid export membrane protein
MAVTPLVYARHRDPATPLALERIFRYYVAAALLVGLGLSLFADEILRVLTPPMYYDAAPVVPLLVPALFLANLYVFMPGLEIAKRTTTFAAINLSGALLNLALTFLLIPRLGIVGAALATLISAAAVFGAYAVGSQRAYPVPHQWHRLATAVVAVSVVYAVVSRIDLDAVATVLLKAAAMIAALAVVSALGLFRRVSLASVIPD